MAVPKIVFDGMPVGVSAGWLAYRRFFRSLVWLPIPLWIFGFAIVSITGNARAAGLLVVFGVLSWLPGLRAIGLIRSTERGLQIAGTTLTYTRFVLGIYGTERTISLQGTRIDKFGSSLIAVVDRSYRTLLAVGDGRVEYGDHVCVWDFPTFEASVRGAAANGGDQ